MKMRFTCRACGGSLNVPLSLTPQDVVVECSICRARHRVTTSAERDTVRYLGNLEPTDVGTLAELKIPEYQAIHSLAHCVV